MSESILEITQEDANNLNTLINGLMPNEALTIVSSHYNDRAERFSLIKALDTENELADKLAFLLAEGNHKPEEVCDKLKATASHYAGMAGLIDGNKSLELSSVIFLTLGLFGQILSEQGVNDLKDFISSYQDHNWGLIRESSATAFMRIESS